VLFKGAVTTELKRLAATTRANYSAGLERFAMWLNSREPGAAPLDPLSWLLSRGAARSNALVSEYLVMLDANALAPGTIALRLAPLKWGVSLARKMGLVDWELFVKGPAVRPYKDVRGHAPEDTQQMLVAIKGTSEIDLRDRAIVLLLACLALRRSEVASLRVCDFDPERKTLMVRGKGHVERARLSVPVQVSGAIVNYLASREAPPTPEGPLLVAYSRSQTSGRALTSNALYKRVRTLARRAGIQGRVTPHGFRHCAITQALNALDGDIRRVSSFARHAKIQTTTIYDDDRQDLAGGVANVLADLVVA
jgi:integrase